MNDPVTIGSVVALILGMAAEAVFKGGLGEVGKNAYKALKDRVSQWTAADVAALDENPGSLARRAVIAEVIDRQDSGMKDSVRQLAVELARILEDDAKLAPIGIDIKGPLEAARIRLENITVHEGTGFRAESLKTTGELEVSNLNVGVTPGKPVQ